MPEIADQNDVVWFYTTLLFLQKLGQEGAIPPAPKFDDCKPVVLLSTNSEREPMAFAPATMDDVLRNGQVVRVGFHRETARHDWAAIRHIGGMPLKTAEQYEELARKLGANPQEWRASFNPLPLKERTALHQRGDHGWIALRSF